ncbi:MAG: hypothetical protein KFF50_07675 [Desulfatitalea sp.]|nr:hypothetical protein [Desulfatitalea sp.]
MITQVFLDKKVHKSLEQLRHSGKKAALAASRAEEIVARMRLGEIVPDRVGTMTKHGELRIKGVMKYDLGSGYRLVTYKHRRQLFLLYVGNHDDCHRWIENNRELSAAQVKERCTALAIEVDEQHLATLEDAPEPVQDDYDPLESLNERDLRAIFSGLVGEQA